MTGKAWKIAIFVALAITLTLVTGLEGLATAQGKADAPSSEAEPEPRGTQGITFQRSFNFPFDDVSATSGPRVPKAPVIIKLEAGAVSEPSLCQVTLDTTTDGMARNVQVDCEVPSLHDAVKKAFERSRYQKLFIKGRPAERRNLVFDIRFESNGEVSCAPEGCEVTIEWLETVYPDAFDTVCIGCCSPDGCRERQVVPIRAQQIVYPSEARARGLEGTCQVRLDVNPRGVPMRVQAECSDPVFVAPVEAAYWEVSFAPKIVRGERVGHENLVYKVEFSLEEGVICPRQDCNVP